RSPEFCRTVPDIVFALLFVAAFGLGPLAGILASGIHSLGALGKRFTEVVENIDMKPVDGVRSAGATFVQTMRFAVVPQVAANFASYALLRFEINVRSGSVVGIVGAGGIGQDLFVAIRKFYYTDVSAILLMIIVTVALREVSTERVRLRLGRLERGGWRRALPRSPPIRPCWRGIAACLPPRVDGKCAPAAGWPWRWALPSLPSG